MRNSMTCYNVASTMGVHDMNNNLLLRVDIHRSFDQRNWCIIPFQGKPMVQCLGLGRHMVPTYQFRELHPLRVAKEFLYARLAWSIFGMVNYSQKPNLELIIYNEVADRYDVVESQNAISYKTAAKGRVPKRVRGAPPGTGGALEEVLAILEENLGDTYQATYTAGGLAVNLNRSDQTNALATSQASSDGSTTPED